MWSFHSSAHLPTPAAPFSASLTFSRQLPNLLRMLTTWCNLPEHSYFLFQLFFASSSHLSSFLCTSEEELFYLTLTSVLDFTSSHISVASSLIFSLSEREVPFIELLCVPGPCLAFSICVVLSTLQNCPIHMPKAGLWHIISFPSLLKLQWLLTAYTAEHGFLSLSNALEYQR